MHDEAAAPRLVIARAEVSALARADDVADRRDGFLDRRLEIVGMEIPDIDIAGVQALQARVDFMRQPAPAEAAVVGLFAHPVVDLGREYPAIALRGDHFARDLLGYAFGVAVCGIDEIDARVGRRIRDALRGRLVGTLAEHHRAQAQLRYFQSAFAESAIFHGGVLCVGV